MQVCQEDTSWGSCECAPEKEETEATGGRSGGTGGGKVVTGGRSGTGGGGAGGQGTSGSDGGGTYDASVDTGVRADAAPGERRSQEHRRARGLGLNGPIYRVPRTRTTVADSDGRT